LPVYFTLLCDRTEQDGTVLNNATLHDAHDVTMRHDEAKRYGTERYGTELYFTIQCDKTLHCRALLDNATKHYGTELYSTGHHLTMRPYKAVHDDI